ncbi:hypothetical protein KUTeg_009859 [Tegillarca granosa]|uniref:Uncharacterized protein n=1 Tax=Tegillarca granosa TaxID=220873 RepID=A0ABQ9F543_TEGGR|nr:hypothetical protein KUTeg_009859 [Tegillarca granosa]
MSKHAMERDRRTSMQATFTDWEDLDKEYVQLQLDHEQYKKKLEELLLCQKKCLNGIAHHRYRIKRIQDTLKKVGITDDPEFEAEIKELNQKIANRKNEFREMEDILPHKNGYEYKHDYERFKVIVSYITLTLSLVMLVMRGYRWVDAVLHFLFVWYYCTLTIRENILIVNGSRPDGYTYQAFRTQGTIFSLYLSCMYVLQFFYQRGSLYRLRALGQGHEMDLTVESLTEIT